MITMQEQLQLKLTSLEAYSRRETLRLYGVPEGIGIKIYDPFCGEATSGESQHPPRQQLYRFRERIERFHLPHQMGPSPGRSW